MSERSSELSPACARRTGGYYAALFVAGLLVLGVGVLAVRPTGGRPERVGEGPARADTVRLRLPVAPTAGATLAPTPVTQSPAAPKSMPGVTESRPEPPAQAARSDDQGQAIGEPVEPVDRVTALVGLLCPEQARDRAQSEVTEGRKAMTALKRLRTACGEQAATLLSDAPEVNGNQQSVTGGGEDG